ncbi:unnamed protein product [Menidia menidia]|uniref:(Atlantic silverside) hypothetical protein n=1 Tax=Menidia menidia TaxID=238744 RepID=A0A8S4BQ12_9TELE|nr:unnamed protein product [Menidia menidia]
MSAAFTDGGQEGLWRQHVELLMVHFPFLNILGRRSTAEAGQKAWMTCGAGEERTMPALERLDLI